jgi:hypothetical protein
MSRFMILSGFALIAVSVAFAFITGNPTFTLWIPAILGVLVALFGWRLSKGQPFSLAIIRFVAALGLTACVLQLFRGGFNLTSHAKQAQLITAALCALILARSLSRSEPPIADDVEWRRMPPRP